MARNLAQFLRARDAAIESIQQEILEPFAPSLKYGADEIVWAHDKFYDVSGKREYRCNDYDTDSIRVSEDFINQMLELPVHQRAAFVKTEVDRRKVIADEQAKQAAERTRQAAIVELEKKLAQLRSQS